MNDNYSKLISKIEVFIRKYYKNQLIKGGILSIALIISFFLLAVSLEHLVHFGIFVRRIIFYLYIATALAIIIHYIIRPIAGIIRIGKRLSKEEAARIIGSHFPQIKDKLLNTLQLQSAIKIGEDNSIIEAAIEQKAEQLSPIPFQTAINFSVNKKYNKYIIPPIVILLFIYIISPKFILEPTERIIYHNTEFIEKAPFEFNILNKELICLQGDDYLLNVNIEGEIIPDEVFIVIDNYPFKINKTTNIEFSYLFKKLNSSKSFYFKSGKFSSPTYSIEVKPSPKIVSFSLKVDYPKYLHRKSDIIKNAGDITIPEGTYIQWTFNTKDITLLNIILPKFTYLLEPKQNTVESKAIKFTENFRYSLHAENEFTKNSDTLHYFVEVIKDQYPRIKVNSLNDSLDDKVIYFRGNISDDYGFSSLKFKWKSINETSGEYSSKKISLQNKSNKQSFYYYINIDSLGIAAGETINYYFEVRDNDGINGAKSAKSTIQSIHKKSFKEIDSLRNINNDELKLKMEESIEHAYEINKKVEKLKKELVDKKTLDWKDKKQIKELLNEYEKMLNNMEEIKKQQEKTKNQNKELTKEDERLLEKQKQLQKLFEKLLTPEMKEMMNEMQKMMQEEMKKEDAQKMLEKIEMDNKDLEKQLDRDLEIFKQMEFDQKLQEAINKLDSVQKQQEDLSNKLENKEISTDEAEKKQKELNSEFKEFEKKLEDAKKANIDLEKPNEMEDFEKEKSDIKQKMEESSEKLDDGKKKSASKIQKSASESMKSLSEKLQQMQSEMESESNAENMEDLRDILSNLIEVSFAQENLMNKTQQTSHTDPNYPKLISEQKKIRNDFKMIEDSLLALSKRQPNISPMVTKELSDINRNMNTTLDLLLDLNTIGYTGRNKKKSAIGKQQQIMTSVNNLALMLSESLEQMQKQQQKSGSGKCKKPKPGQKGGNMKSIRQMQQALNKQMKRMQQKMKEGKGPKGKKKGKKNGGQNGEKMSEEMARMAAQQELIRKKLQAQQNALKKAGRGEEAKGLNKTVKDMEQNETDLVNSLILRESMMRQQEIVTRLLEAEKAEREQKQEETREATEGQDKKSKNPPEIEEFIEQQKKESELLKTIPPNLKPFYKNKVNRYFEEVNKIK
ncbi:MAG: hypothetical protein B6I18_00730 [Bacteroidetes bacterium 4572_112]|nr:MAG: hypothetical protein B6I18_00730 [Bacteroidetes bacterium 4572_112]